jgi:hypothetical protein
VAHAAGLEHHRRAQHMVIGPFRAGAALSFNLPELAAGCGAGSAHDQSWPVIRANGDLRLDPAAKRA